MIVGVVLMVLAAMFGGFFFQSVPVGHVSVATLFGKVQQGTYEEGLHFPVNPFLSFHQFDVRQKTHLETAGVPSRDQLTTKLDVSIQYRLVGSMAAQMLQNTGNAKDVVDVHMIPKLRSVLREQGKSIERAEDFFKQEVQAQLQNSLLASLKEFSVQKGIEVQAVLIRNVTLPPFIMKAIESKKEREQAAEKQKAELERFRTEQEQKVAEAVAKRQASEEEAKQIKLLADAKAYEIEKVNTAISNNPAYIQLQALKSLEAISKDPSSKLYFMNSDSPNPLPLMHMGENK